VLSGHEAGADDADLDHLERMASAEGGRNSKEESQAIGSGVDPDMASRGAFAHV
jgi:hypothetical protein